MRNLVKCQCGKKIVFKRTENRPIEEDEDEPIGMYSAKPKNLYGATSSATPTEEVRIYACEDDMCIYSHEMTETEYLELEDEENEEL